MRDAVKKYLEGSPPFLQPEGFLHKRGKHKMRNYTHSEQLMRLDAIKNKKLDAEKAKVIDELDATKVSLNESVAKNTRLEKEIEDTKAKKG